MNGPCALAIDQGSHATRAIVYDGRGEALATASRTIQTRIGEGGRVEHDAAAIVAATRAAIDAAIEAAGAAGARISVAGLATQRSTVVCWRRADGEPLSPAISWRDLRQQALIDGLRAHAGRVRSLTGLPLSAHYGASKIRWCLDHLPAVARAAARGDLVAGPLSSFLVRNLTGASETVDPANASRTQLWSPASGQWCAPLLELFGLQRQWLPRCVPTRYAFGSLRCGAREVPLAIVTGDQSAVPFAFGPPDMGTAYVNAGTGAFIQLPARAPAEPPLLASVLCRDDDRTLFAIEGTVNGSGAALDWLRERHGIDAADPALAAAAAREADPPPFLNSVAGIGSPFWKTGFEPRFEADAAAPARLAAVIDSIAFLIAENLDAMRDQGAVPTRILLTGGVAASDRLAVCLAQICGLPVDRALEKQATARGVAALALGACARFASVPSQRFEPGPEDGARARRQRWRAAFLAALAD
ncbi:MAG: FGGY family carbohydrate kinase [Gammaproteobacteria bacterium]